MHRTTWLALADLAMSEKALQRLISSVPLAVSELGQGRRRKRNLSEWRQAFLDEPLEPAQRRSLVARRVGVRQEFAEQERVGKGKPARLSWGHLRSQKMPTIDSALEASACCPLRCHSDAAGATADGA
jgi:hypothetical protein